MSEIMNNLPYICMVIFSSLCWFALIRELICWYFKINERVKLQKEVVTNQKEIIVLMMRQQDIIKSTSGTYMPANS